MAFLLNTAIILALTLQRWKIHFSLNWEISFISRQPYIYQSNLILRHTKTYDSTLLRWCKSIAIYIFVLCTKYDVIIKIWSIICNTCLRNGSQFPKRTNFLNWVLDSGKMENIKITNNKVIPLTREICGTYTCKKLIISKKIDLK